MPAHVYILESESTGKFYIGSSRDIERRFEQHLSLLKLGKHQNLLFQQTWSEAQDFCISTLATTETYEEAYQLEQSLISGYAGDPNMLNISLGGDSYTLHPLRDYILAKRNESITAANQKLKETDPEAYRKRFIEARQGELNGMYGQQHTPEAKAIMAEARKGKSPANKGVPLTPEQRAKVSAAAKLRVGEKNPFYGQVHSDESKAAIGNAAKGRLNGTGFTVSIEGVEYPSYWKAAEALGIGLTTIRHRCLSNNPKFSQYQLLSTRPTAIESTATEE